MNLADILPLLNSPKPDGKGGYFAFCPCHPDGSKRGRRSLHISERNGRLLFHCFAGCRFEDIAEALGLRRQPQREEPLAIYRYVDEEGKLVYEVLRFPGKRFLQRRPGKGGEWIYNLQGVRRVLYRLPEVLTAVREGRTIFLVEGEKDCDNLTRLGLTATTNPGGAGKWLTEYNECLRGANVIIIPDNDETGRRHAEQVAASLAGVAASVKLVKLPGLPPKGDVSDWLASGHTKEELLTLVQQAPEWGGPQARGPEALEERPKLWTAQELAAADFPEPSWLIPGLVPEGGLILLAGRPKTGKSWLALDLATGLASGTTVCGVQVERRLNTLYLAMEDTPLRLQARLKKAGLEAPTGCFIATSWPRLNAGGMELLEKAVTEHGIGLVIIDTLAKIRPRQGRVVSLYDADYEMLGLLKELADRFGITVLVVHHLRKAGSDDPLEEVSGTSGLTGAVDTVLVLKRGRGQADGTVFVTGRDVEEQELALRFEAGKWEVLGNAREWTVTQERRQVLDLLAENGPLGPKEIAAALGKTEGAVKMLLLRMHHDGLLTRAGKGKYAVTASSSCEEGKHENLSYQSYRVTGVTRVTELPSRKVTPVTLGGVTDETLAAQGSEGEGNSVTQVTAKLHVTSDPWLEPDDPWASLPREWVEEL